MNMINCITMRIVEETLPDASKVYGVDMNGSYIPCPSKPAAMMFIRELERITQYHTVIDSRSEGL